MRPPITISLLAVTLFLTPVQAQDSAGVRDAIAKLQPEIDLAIDKGVAWLIENQLRDGSWAYHTTQYPTGQTALSVYTLLKSGLPTSHPAVARALHFLKGRRAHETYSASLQMMAFQATHEAEWQARIPSILQDLLDWHVNDGSWGYPGNYDHKPGWTDLSNMQYAVLGLRAAAQAGYEAPLASWLKIIKSMGEYQDRPVEMRVQRGGRQAIETGAGFRYRVVTQERSGSMTAAGVTVLAVCREVLGKRLEGRGGADVDHRIRLGLNWLDANFTVTENIGKGGWLYYYLYGLERVGSLLRIETIGEHPWYLDGARFLLEQQGEDGSWNSDTRESDTCFGVLFLKRATRGGTSGQPGTGKIAEYSSKDESDDVRIYAKGDETMLVRVAGFSPGIMKLFGRGEEPLRILPITRVEYIVDGASIASVEVDPRKIFRGQGWPVQHRFVKAGKHVIEARVTLAPEATDTEPVVLASKPLDVDVKNVFEPWMRQASEIPARNLIAGQRFIDVTTSTVHKGYDGRRALDGHEGTAWLCDDKDLRPSISFTLRRSVVAGALSLSHSMSRVKDRTLHDRILRVAVAIDGGHEPFVFDLDPDVLKPTVFRFPEPRKIRRLEIRILAREPAASYPGLAGFSEIALLP